MFFVKEVKNIGFYVCHRSYYSPWSPVILLIFSFQYYCCGNSCYERLVSCMLRVRPLRVPVSLFSHTGRADGCHLFGHRFGRPWRVFVFLQFFCVSVPQESKYEVPHTVVAGRKVRDTKACIMGNKSIHNWAWPLCIYNKYNKYQSQYDTKTSSQISRTSPLLSSTTTCSSLSRFLPQQQRPAAQLHSAEDEGNPDADLFCGLGVGVVYNAFSRFVASLPSLPVSFSVGS